MSTLYPPIVIVNGPARIGKTTMQNHLLETYGKRIVMIEPSRALKTHYMMTTLSPSSALRLGAEASKYIQYMRDNKEYLLGQYEQFKKENRVTREEIILYAESIRAVKPSFWVDLAILLDDVDQETDLIWVEAINQQEFLEVKTALSAKFPQSKQSVVRLVCLNPESIVKDDTRDVVDQADDFVFYSLEKSKKVADFIFNQFKYQPEECENV
jgi:hypothetical protein